MDQSPTLYIRLRKHIKIYKDEKIYLRDVAEMIIDPEYEEKLGKIVLFRPEMQDGNLVLIDMMRIVRNVRRIFPEMNIEHYGEPHVIVEILTERSRKSPNFILISLVWVLLFIGSGLAIMNFHADVSMPAVHKRIYQLITGHVEEHPYILQIPYSIGVGLGMILFFNHLFKKKFNEEPSPLEVEMFLYQENLNQYVVTEEYGKMNNQEPPND